MGLGERKKEQGDKEEKMEMTQYKHGYGTKERDRSQRRTYEKRWHLNGSASGGTTSYDCYRTLGRVHCTYKRLKQRGCVSIICLQSVSLLLVLYVIIYYSLILKTEVSLL